MVPLSPLIIMIKNTMWKRNKNTDCLVSNKNMTARFSLIQMGYSIAAAGIVVAYLVPLYKYFGFSVTKIGILTAIAYISSIIAEPVLGRLCDEKYKTSIVVIVAMILGIIAFGIIYFCHGNMILVVLAVITLYSTTPSLAYLISQWSVKLKNSGMIINFGVSRAAGSLGYGVFAALFGKLLEIRGYEIILPFFAFFSLITIVLLVTVKTPFTKATVEVRTEVHYWELLKSKTYVLLAVAALLSFIGSYCITVFLSLRVEEIGGSISAYGGIIFIEGVVEVIAILMYEHIAKCISNYWSMMVCFMLSFISAIVMSFADTLLVMYMGMVIHGMFTGFYVSGIALYIPEIVDQKLTYTAAMLVASCLGMAASITSLYVAFATKIMCLQTTMKVATVMPALAIVIFVFSRKEN